MKRSLKDILKVSKVLYLDNQSTIPLPVKNSVSYFFNKVFYVDNLTDAIYIYEEEKPNVIISNSVLDNMSTLKFLATVRNHNYTIPIIVTSDFSNDELFLNIIRLQAIDFIKKPIKSENMIYALNLSAKHILRGEKLVVDCKDSISYDYVSKTVIKNKKNITLTKNEAILIELLLSNNGKITSKSEIEFKIWGETYVNDSTFKSLIQRLKTKIGKDVIQNKHGYGYFLSSIS